MNDAIIVSNPGQVSDGYHTFDELYDHRNLLFINLCKLRANASWIKTQEDYPGYFCLYTAYPEGQISYHIPNKYLHMVEALNKINNRANTEEWDGHTSNDVLKRLIAQGENEWW